MGGGGGRAVRWGTIRVCDQDHYPYLNDVSDDLSDDEGDYTSLHMFLAAHGLMDWAGKLTKERIDLDALMLLSEADLSESLGMPLGPRKKLMKAVADRRRDMEEPDDLTDTQF